MIRVGRLLLTCLILLPLQSFSADSNLDKARENFLAAENALSKGQMAQFESLMQRLENYPLYSYLRYKALRRGAVSISKYEEFLRNYPNSRYESIVRHRFLSYLASNRLSEKYIQHYRETRDVEARCNYNRALYRVGREEEAFSGAKSLWLVGNSQPIACDPLFEVWQKTPQFNADIVWQRFALSLKESNTGLANYLTRYLSAEDQKIAKQWLAVHQSPKSVSKLDGKSSKPEILGKMFVHGIDRLTSKHPQEALELWRARQALFKIDPVDRAELDKRLAMAHVYRRHAAAYVLLDEINDDLSDEDVRTWRLRSALLNKDWLGVLKSFERLDHNEKASPNWLYWQARALDEIGKTKEAEAIFHQVAKDRSFYGFMAADLLKMPYELNDRPAMVENKQIDDLAASVDFRAVEEFRHFDRLYDARGQWWAAVANLTDEQLLVAAKIAQQWGWHQIAIFTISRAEYWDDLNLRFPLGFTETVKKHAAHNKLAPEIVLGVIRQESAFDYNAKSPAGARGLMQIMPQTGKQIARELKEKFNNDNELYNPDSNVRFGTHYLKGLLNRFSGNLALATAAYNAGPHRVDRWLPKDSAMPTDVWAELIPYRETRRYVASVLAYTIIYQQRLGVEEHRVSKFIPDINPKAGSISQSQTASLKSKN